MRVSNGNRLDLFFVFSQSAAQISCRSGPGDSSQLVENRRVDERGKNSAGVIEGRGRGESALRCVNFYIALSHIETPPRQPSRAGSATDAPSGVVNSLASFRRPSW